MRTAAPISVTCWRLLFLALESGLFFAVFALAIIERVYGRQTVADSRPWQALIAVFFVAAWLFLLIVSPFFLKSLRWIALTGWLIAMAILLFSSLTL